MLSNDTDLKTPLKVVKHKLGKQIGIISPIRKIHEDLKNISDFKKAITNEILSRCQFPIEMKDSKGSFFCPPEWNT